MKFKSLQLPITAIATCALAVNLMMPKGGLYLDRLPLTWGYILLAAVGTVGWLELLLAPRLSARRDSPLLIAATLILLYAGYCAAAILIFGYNPEAKDDLIGYFV